MNENKLTMEQEEQISNLLKVIIEQSKLFPDLDPLLVKISFSKLQSLNISFPEAKDLIRYLNRKIGTNDSYIDILNGTIIKYEGVIGTMVTEVFEELDGVDIDDDKDSLILWIRNLNIIKNDIEEFFNVDILKSNLKSRYENNEIIIGKKRLKINQNSNANDFCDVVFSYKPKTPISWSDILERIEGPTPEKLGRKDFKIIENIKSNLNKELYDIGIKDILFSQRKKMMYRNY